MNTNSYKIIPSTIVILFTIGLTTKYYSGFYRGAWFYPYTEMAALLLVYGSALASIANTITSIIILRKKIKKTYPWIILGITPLLYLAIRFLSA